jgi:16S rRNA (cytosine1402-N4)-methyltransferase
MVTTPRGFGHEPVLYNETLTELVMGSGGLYIDATLGSAGHAAAILEKSAPDGRLLGIDADPDALVVARERLSIYGERVTLAQSNYAHIGLVARQHGFADCQGILFDLGLSSRQLSSEGRGFSFQDDAILDMRLDPAQAETAADLCNMTQEQDLANLIYQLGDEPASRRIARAIVLSRPIRTTGQLAAVIEKSIGRHGKLHPATKTFMALRRAVNREDESLQAALPQAVELLAPGGRLVVIAFHSSEDRTVKEFMRREAKDCLCPPTVPPGTCLCGHHATLKLITRHVIQAGDDERRSNPRSRSAKLRVAEKLDVNV